MPVTGHGPRTPLRNIGNFEDASRFQMNFGKPFLHRNVIALRTGGANVAKQVEGQTVRLATSPVQKQLGNGEQMMRSPMTGRTPDDVKRQSKKYGTASVCNAGPSFISSCTPPTHLIFAAPNLSLQTASCFQYQVQMPMTSNPSNQQGPPSIMPTSPFTSTLPPSKELATKPSYEPASIPVDSAKEAARIKRQEAKVKREAKAALKAAQESLRKAEELRDAEDRALLLAHQNSSVLECIANVHEEEYCDLDLIEPIRNVPWELISIGHCLQILNMDCKVEICAVELHHIEEALRIPRPNQEHLNVLASLHSVLLVAACSDNKTKSATTANKTSTSWMSEVKKWASAQLQSRSPFLDETLVPQKKEGSREYKNLSYAEKLLLLHELACAAMTRLLEGREIDKIASELRPAPLGRDSHGRLYWHASNATTSKAGEGGAAWVLRECAAAPQRSRLSVLSSEGTPIKGDALMKSLDFSPPAERGERAADAHARGGGEKEEEEALLDSGCWSEHAPERGEEGENYYWHKQWVAVMSRASRACYSHHSDPPPLLELIATDEHDVARFTKALWLSGIEENKELARVVASLQLQLRAAAATTAELGTQMAVRRSARTHRAEHAQALVS